MRAPLAQNVGASYSRMEKRSIAYAPVGRTAEAPLRLNNMSTKNTESVFGWTVVSRFGFQNVV